MGARIVGGSAATQQDIQCVGDALARASRDLDAILTLLQQLRRRLLSERARRARVGSGNRTAPQASRPSTAPSQGAGRFGPRRQVNYRRLIQRGGTTTARRQFESELRQPVFRALAVSFIIDFTNRLDEAVHVVQEIRDHYAQARAMLGSDNTAIYLRRGSMRPPGIPATAYARAPLSSDEPHMQDSVMVFDAFFGRPDQDRLAFLRRAGRRQDFTLFRAAILVHECLHWRLGAGHHRNGILGNPQNYELFMILRYCTNLLAPSVAWPFATPVLPATLDPTPRPNLGIDQWRRW